MTVSQGAAAVACLMSANQCQTACLETLTRCRANNGLQGDPACRQEFEECKVSCDTQRRACTSR